MQHVSPCLFNGVCQAPCVPATVQDTGDATPEKLGIFLKKKVGDYSSATMTGEPYG